MCEASEWGIPLLSELNKISLVRDTYTRSDAYIMLPEGTTHHSNPNNK